MTNDSPPLGPVGLRSPLLPVLLLGLGLGIVIGLGLGRATPVAPRATAPPGAGASPSATTPGAWVTGASVAPELMRAYFATRVTSAGVAPVVCTTDAGLTCQGVPALYLANATPTSPQVPGPDELWPQLGPAHLTQTGGTAHVLLIDDLDFSLYSSAGVQGAPPGEPWHAVALVSPVTVNGAVEVMDLGRLGVGQFVVLIRHVLSVPPDPQGLVESWKVIGIEVD